MAQAVERRIGSAEVTGPIPVGSFKNSYESKNNRNNVPVIFCVIVYLGISETNDFLTINLQNDTIKQM